MSRLGKLVSTSSAWLCLVPNPEPVHQTAKCVGMDVEDGSRSVRSADHPAGSLEHSQNMLTLYILERIRRLQLHHGSRFYFPAGFLSRLKICYEFENSNPRGLSMSKGDSEALRCPIGSQRVQRGSEISARCKRPKSAPRKMHSSRL